ncbi:hypothetical protein Tco_1121637 [Tanacetum coccineum]|uniref:Retrotransposon protein, putative, unclassified n=1 Tax=Tanacetum coccineum TaxID=301880 RepID=A0ABQ5J0H8_9ASTR
MESSDPVDTPMVEKSKLDEEKSQTGVRKTRKALDTTHYHGMMHLINIHPTLITRIAKILDEVLLDVCNYWEIDLLAGYQKMRLQLTKYDLGFNKIPMYYDNNSAITLCCNNVQHSRSKHIGIRFHFIKEQVENGVVELYFVNTEYQLVDIFTKALCRERIEFLINKLRMRSFTPETLK